MPVMCPHYRAMAVMSATVSRLAVVRTEQAGAPFVGMSAVGGQREVITNTSLARLRRPGA